MNKFVGGMIAGAAIGSVASVAVKNINIPKKREHQTIGKTLHTLGNMAENIIK